MIKTKIQKRKRKKIKSEWPYNSLLHNLKIFFKGSLADYEK